MTLKKEKHTWARAAYMSHLPAIKTEGYKVGVFGLYKGKGVWLVTHLPTGRGVHLLERSSLAACVTAVTKAQEETCIEWGFSDKDAMTRELRKRGPEEIDKLRTF